MKTIKEKLQLRLLCGIYMNLNMFSNLCWIWSKKTSASSFYKENNFKPCLTKQLLNMFKLWWERGIIRPLKTKPEDRNRRPTRKKGIKRCKYVFFPVLSMFPPHHVFHCTKDALLEELPGSLISINTSKFPGYYRLCYSVCLFLFIFLCLGFRYISYTQMIAEIDGINFVFLFSSFCQLSRQAFISNRINERVSGKPTNLNWPPRTSGEKYIPENPSIESPKFACVSRNSRNVSGLFWVAVSRYRLVSIVKDKLFESQFRARKSCETFQKRPLWSQISYNSYVSFPVFLC